MNKENYLGKKKIKELSINYYQTDNVTNIARSLIGKALISNIDNKKTAVIISETEAYSGINDKASHAYGDRRTKRTEVMYAIGGTIYVYLCYGMHHLFNIVTNKREIPDAILVRGGIPIEGIQTMMKRRGNQNCNELCSGPGKLSQALGITTSLSGTEINNSPIIITEAFQIKEPNSIICSPRIGVEYAKEDALLPYRFSLKKNILKF